LVKKECLTSFIFGELLEIHGLETLASEMGMNGVLKSSNALPAVWLHACTEFGLKIEFFLPSQHAFEFNLGHITFNKTQNYLTK
jgi:hypothetical protein